MVGVRNGKKSFRYRRFIYAIILANATSIVLFALRFLSTQDTLYWFLIWNLFLAWLPAFFAYFLIERLRNHRWSELWCIVLSILWLSFLPNSFYMVSDLIHLHTTGEINIVFDVVMFISFIINGFIAGYGSMIFIHREFQKRFYVYRAYVAMLVIILASSYAIYLGRTLRWNSWDIVLHPAGILFDVGSSVVDPIVYPQAIITTGIFFVLISSIYAVIWELIALM